MASTISGGLSVTGGLTVDSMTLPADSVVNATIASGADIATEKIAQRPLAKYLLDFTLWRVWDAAATNLPGTGSNDDLGFSGTTWGLTAPAIVLTSISNTTATRRARFRVCLPQEYDAGQDIQIRFECSRTNAAEVSMTIDLEAVKITTDSAFDTDICATSAIDINAAANTTADFTLTATGRAAGDMLDCRVTVAADDTGGAGANMLIWAAYLLCDTRG